MKELLDILLEELKDENSYIRQNAARKLGKLGNKKAVKYLKDTLEDQNKDVRLKAVIALGEIGGAEAPKALLKAIKDKDINVKREAVNSLGKIGDFNTIRSLETLVNEKDIKINIIQALGQIGYTKPLFDIIFQEDNEFSDQAASMLGQICNKTDIPYLIKALSSPSWNIRAGAIEALGRLRHSDSLEKVAKFLEDANDNVRSQVARALGKMGDERSIPYLIKALKDRYWDVRRNAAESLGNMESEESIDSLIEALKDENAGVRNNVVEALGKIKTKKSILPLLNTLKDQDPTVRGNAAKSLGLLGYLEVKEGLEKALHEEQDPWVKRYLDEAISYLQLEPETIKKKKILLVDDDKFIVKLLKITLQEDYETNVAYNGEEAVLRAKIERPDLILLDIMMPKMDGFEVTQTLKMDNTTRFIPIIIVSAKSQDKDLENIKKLGVAGYIRKPFNTIKLLQMIEEVLKVSEQ